MHKVLVNRLVKLAQEKRVVKCSDRPDMTIAVDWNVKILRTRPNKKQRIGLSPGLLEFDIANSVNLFSCTLVHCYGFHQMGYYLHSIF